MLETPLIIGIYGHKQSGKSTMAKCLWDMHEDAFPLPFADPLKSLVKWLLIPSDWKVSNNNWFDSEKNKNLELPCGLTVRQALQKIGTDWFRQLWPDIWVNRWFRNLDLPNFKSMAGIVVVPDVRFPNEWQLIKDMGGITVKLLRNPLPPDGHASEGALDQLSNEAWAWVLDNRDMTVAEQNAATREFFTPIFQEYDHARYL